MSISGGVSLIFRLESKTHGNVKDPCQHIFITCTRVRLLMSPTMGPKGSNPPRTMEGASAPPHPFKYLKRSGAASPPPRWEKIEERGEEREERRERGEKRGNPNISLCLKEFKITLVHLSVYACSYMFLEFRLLFGTYKLERVLNWMSLGGISWFNYLVQKLLTPNFIACGCQRWNLAPRIHDLIDSKETLFDNSNFGGSANFDKQDFQNNRFCWRGTWWYLVGVTRNWTYWNFQLDLIVTFVYCFVLGWSWNEDSPTLMLGYNDHKKNIWENMNSKVVQPFYLIILSVKWRPEQVPKPVPWANTKKRTF